MQVSSRVVINVGTSIEDAKRLLVLGTVAYCNGDLDEAAEMLKVRPVEVKNMMEKWKNIIENEERREPLSTPMRKKAHFPCPQGWRE
jgi:hypothetical protein